MVSGAAWQGTADAEAAAWVARLHGDARTPDTDAGLKAWLDADPAHGDAFERATEIWAMIPGAALRRAADPAAPAQVHILRPRLPLRQLALAASLLLVIGIGSFFWLLGGANGYSTAVGEQQVATLEDGSRIALNTDSRVEVRFDDAERLVELEHGEAMFEVAHNASRPFIVRAGNKQVRAVGTSFVVRRQGDDVVVTLIQGKVVVTDLRAPRDVAPAWLAPGERLKAFADGPVRIDQQPVEAATAWRRGQAMFGDTPLADAVAELNRYGGPRIEVDDPGLAALPVSGVFATNDTEEFAQAVAALHSLKIMKRGGTLHIVR